jgi:hypothetical protein
VIAIDRGVGIRRSGFGIVEEQRDIAGKRHLDPT